MMIASPSDALFMMPAFGADPQMFAQQGFAGQQMLAHGQPPVQQPGMMAAQRQQPVPFYPQQALMEQGNPANFAAVGIGQGGGGNQAVAEGTPAMTGGAPLPGGTSNMGVNVEGINQMVQQDIERGMGIDFYAESNPALLASWATFFRDQFIETRNLLARANNDRLAEAYRRATHFVERAETKVLETKAMKQFFRKHPLTPPNDPAFVDACYRIIIDYNMRNPPFEGFTFGNPMWRDYMWFKAGLMGVVDKGRSKFLLWYYQQITEAWKLFIQTKHNVAPNAGQDAINKVCSAAMEDETSYGEAKRFYAFLFTQVISKSVEEDTSSPTSLPVGSRVRSLFSFDEEAFVLVAVRANISEQGSSETSQILSEAAELSKLLATQEAGQNADSGVLFINEEKGS